MMPELDVIGLIQQFGLPLMIAIVFVVDGRSRERRLADRLDAVQDEQRNKLADVIERNTEAFSRFAEVARRCGGARREEGGQ